MKKYYPVGDSIVRYCLLGMGDRYIEISIYRFDIDISYRIVEQNIENFDIIKFIRQRQTETNNKLQIRERQNK